MSNTNEHIVPKRIGKFVTFSQECDILKKDIENAIVFPKTKAPEKVVQAVTHKAPTFPQVEEVIHLPYREYDDKLHEDVEDCMPSSSRRRRSGKRTRRESSSIVELLRRKHDLGIARQSNQMDVIGSKLKRIYELKLMDDLTTLCKEKMSISTKEIEKMDEDSND